MGISVICKKEIAWLGCTIVLDEERGPTNLPRSPAPAPTGLTLVLTSTLVWFSIWDHCPIQRSCHPLQTLRTVSNLCCWDSLVMSLADLAFTTEVRSVSNSQQPSSDLSVRITGSCRHALFFLMFATVNINAFSIPYQQPYSSVGWELKVHLWIRYTGTAFPSHWNIFWGDSVWCSPSWPLGYVGWP